MTFSYTKNAFSFLNNLENKSFKKKVKRQLIGKDLQNINGILGEVRCYGYLSNVFGTSNVSPIKETKEINPDFELKCENDLIIYRS